MYDIFHSVCIFRLFESLTEVFSNKVLSLLVPNSQLLPGLASSPCLACFIIYMEKEFLILRIFLLEKIEADMPSPLSEDHQVDFLLVIPEDRYKLILIYASIGILAISFYFFLKL